MVRSLKFSSLEEMAQSSLKCHVLEENLDREELYLRVLKKKGLNEYDTELYMRNVRNAAEDFALYARLYPQHVEFFNLLREFSRTYCKYDKRNPELSVYRAETLLMVVLIASCCGCTTSEEYARFWFEHHPLLSCMLEMPEPNHMIHPDTINTILSLVPSDAFEALFLRMFSIMSNPSESLMDEDFKPGMKKTLGGDGQELRASYRRGVSNRKKKGAQGVTLYDCDGRAVVDYTTVTQKNHEVDAFIKLLSRLSVNDEFIFYADAINTRANLIDFINEREIDWLLPVKNNGSCKELRTDIKSAFDTEDDENKIVEETANKTGGRVESRRYSFHPASVVHSDKFKNLGTLIKVEKRTLFPRKGATEPLRRPEKSEIVYISSLPFNEDNAFQLRHSLEVRWRYEAHHNTLDEVMLQDRRAMCDENHLSTIIGLNKAVYNILSYARKELLQTRGYTSNGRVTKKITRNTRPLSYKGTMGLFNSNVAFAMGMIASYLRKARETREQN